MPEQASEEGANFLANCQKLAKYGVSGLKTPLLRVSQLFSQLPKVGSWEANFSQLFLMFTSWLNIFLRPLTRINTTFLEPTFELANQLANGSRGME